ncbi:MAG: NADH-quinone oxidoreductase subunit NuoE [Candidatus Nanopelagicales bacterium]
MPLTDQTAAECRELAARYPQARSALLPMLHLVQSEAGMITSAGIELCAEVLDLTTAEVTAVATFYTMYRQHSPGGTHHIGVCVNTGCGLLGGDAVYDALAQRLGVGHNETTDDGQFTLERIECQAACTHAPVMTVDWEYFDRTTVAEAMRVIDELQAGNEVTPTRGPVVRGWRATERTVAGIDDGLADEGGGADALMLAGLDVAKERGMTAPGKAD